MERFIGVLVLLALAIGAFGCAAQGAPPPQATQIPYSPNLYTQSRQVVADQWLKDVGRLKFVEPYMNALCAPDGAWATSRDAWRKDQVAMWEAMWKFQDLPNAPPAGGFDWGKLAEVLIGAGVKAATGGILGAAPKVPLPPGLPAC